jgi:hydroxyacylglutathione hydrolase
MTADNLEELLELDKAPVVLDVRSGFEFGSGHIKGALHAPLPSLLKSASAAVKQKTDPLVIVCEHGPRAQVAAMYLRFRGYKSVELLDGHMSKWRGSNRPMEYVA